MKRLLALLAAVLMCCALCAPALAMADDPLLPEDIQYNGVTLSKSARRTGPDTWEVTLAITPEEELAVRPLEVALVVDTSRSMQNCTISGHNHNADRCPDDKTTRQAAVAESAGALVDSLAAMNGDVSVAVGGFDGSGYMIKALTKLETDSDAAAVKAAIPEAFRSGGTNIASGLKEGAKLFSNSNTAKKVLVLLSDGQHNKPGSPTEEAAKIKNAGAHIYCIGFMLSNTELEAISSGAGCYFSADSPVTLTQAYESVSTSLMMSVSDSAGDKFNMTGSPAVEFSGEAVNYTASIENDVLTFTPSASIASGNTVKITYSEVLDRTKAGPGIYTLEPLNAQAKLHFPADSGREPLDFPLPRAAFELGRLDVYAKLMDGADEVRTQRIGAEQDTVICDWPEPPDFTWDAPATISHGDDAYELELVNSEYARTGGRADMAWRAAKDTVPATAGEHRITFLYQKNASVAPTPTPTPTPTPRPTPAWTPYYPQYYTPYIPPTVPDTGSAGGMFMALSYVLFGLSAAMITILCFRHESRRRK